METDHILLSNRWRIQHRTAGFPGVLSSLELTTGWLVQHSRCNLTALNLSILKNLGYAHEYAVAVLNQLSAFSILEDPVEI